MSGDGRAASAASLCADIVDRVAELVPQAAVRPARTQTAFVRRRTFAAVWSARQWLGERAAPCVLTVWLPEPAASHRWKEVTQVRPGLWAHHLEVSGPEAFDEQVGAWVLAAFAAAA
jgi:hypothetical protein